MKFWNKIIIYYQKLRNLVKLVEGIVGIKG
jgi:hypothetical protein